MNNHFSESSTDETSLYEVMTILGKDAKLAKYDTNTFQCSCVDAGCECNTLPTLVGGEIGVYDVVLSFF